MPLSSIQRYNLDIAEQVKGHNREKRNKSINMTPAYSKASEIWKEVKRQGAIDDERRFEEIRNKVLTRNPRLCK